MGKGSRFISKPDCFAIFYFFHALYYTHTDALVETLCTPERSSVGARDSFGNSTHLEHTLYNYRTEHVYVVLHFFFFFFC